MPKNERPEKTPYYLDTVPAGTSNAKLRKLIADAYQAVRDKNNVVQAYADRIDELEMRIENQEAIIADGQRRIDQLETAESSPIAMILTCPSCSARHIDEGDFATKRHHTHACQSCGMVWRPCKQDTVGVQFLPGYKNSK